MCWQIVVLMRVLDQVNLPLDTICVYYRNWKENSQIAESEIVAKEQYMTAWPYSPC